ncbi:MAG: hypothetical protein NTZ07_00170 [Candidatus Woesebacteria bacterium]|nr:hypothetical protein [Candidatus Woesebacteria bacterium]
MERKRTSGAGNTQNENSISKSGQRWESEVAFGPYRDVIPGEQYDPGDLTLGYKLLPIRKYGPGTSQNKSEPV